MRKLVLVFITIIVAIMHGYSQSPVDMMSAGGVDSLGYLTTNHLLQLIKCKTVDCFNSVLVNNNFKPIDTVRNNGIVVYKYLSNSSLKLSNGSTDRDVVSISYNLEKEQVATIIYETADMHEYADFLYGFKDADNGFKLDERNGDIAMLDTYSSTKLPNYSLLVLLNMGNYKSQKPVILMFMQK